MKLMTALMMAQAWAADGHGAHDAHAIPWNSIFVQAFNLILLLAFLTFILRKTVKAHFANRAQEYQEMVAKAETARKEAEQNKRLIQERLTKLEAESSQSEARARQEAEELRKRMQQDAKAVAERMQQEAERTVQIEIEKAKNELRRELLGHALGAARESIEKNLGSSEQKKLQSEFVQKIEVVGS